MFQSCDLKLPDFKNEGMFQAKTFKNSQNLGELVGTYGNLEELTVNNYVT